MYIDTHACVYNCTYTHLVLQHSVKVVSEGSHQVPSITIHPPQLCKKLRLECVFTTFQFCENVYMYMYACIRYMPDPSPGLSVFLQALKDVAAHVKIEWILGGLEGGRSLI